MKHFYTALGVLVTPLWLVGFVAGVAWIWLASGWMQSHETMLRLLQERDAAKTR